MASDLSLRRAYQRTWRSNNKDKVAEYNRRRRELRRAYKQKMRAVNPRLNAEQLKDWFACHPGKRNAYRAAYNARKKALAPPLTVEETARVTAFYKEAKLLTHTTGIKHHVDHIKPLAKGGLHHPDNLQVLTAQQNQRKSAK